MAYTIIDSEALMTAMLDSIINLPTSPPSLYLDLEGVNLSRHGSISIIELLALPANHLYLIDVHTLGQRTFTTVSANGSTLRSILEDVSIPKAFFDVRNDSDALHAHFQVQLAGIHDIQLMENASRWSSKEYVDGLARCISSVTGMADSQREAWQATKKLGRRLFSPEYGGSYEVFNQRPIPKGIIRYCVQDVLYLPLLWAMYDARLDEEYTPCAVLEWRQRIEEATEARVMESQNEAYEPKGKEKVKGPWGADWMGYSLDDKYVGKACILYTMPHHRAYVMW